MRQAVEAAGMPRAAVAAVIPVVEAEVIPAEAVVAVTPEAAGIARV